MKRVGVNYVPSKNWWWSWQEWDEPSIHRDLDEIAALGCDHARIHLIWSIFQPAPGWIAPTPMRRLVKLLDLMAERGLDACITILDGWLSGLDFTPAWTWDPVRWGRRSVFTDPFALDATESFVRAVVAKTAGHPAVWSYDLANEPNVLTTWNASGPGDAMAWADRMQAAIRETAPDKECYVGVAHDPWLDRNAPFERHWVADQMPMAPVHAWLEFTGAKARFGEDAFATTAIPDFLAEVAVASQDSGTCPVWVQETGTSDAWLTRPKSETITRRLLDACAANPAVEAVTWWCSHDINPRFDCFAECEYDMGLIGLDNHPKPMGRVFAEWAREWRAAETAAARTAALVIPAGGPATLDLLAQWAAAAEQGTRLALVDEERAADLGYLASRGITEIIR